VAHVAQVRLLIGVQALVSYWPPPQVAQALQIRSLAPPQAPVSY